MTLFSLNRIGNEYPVVLREVETRCLRVKREIFLIREFARIIVVENIHQFMDASCSVDRRETLRIGFEHFFLLRNQRGRSRNE